MFPGRLCRTPKATIVICSFQKIKISKRSNCYRRQTLMFCDPDFSRREADPLSEQHLQSTRMTSDEAWSYTWSYSCSYPCCRQRRYRQDETLIKVDCDIVALFWSWPASSSPQSVPNATSTPCSSPYVTTKKTSAALGATSISKSQCYF